MRGPAGDRPAPDIPRAGDRRQQRTEARVSLELTSFVASAACLENTPARALFVLPPAYRPPLTIIREVAVVPGLRFLVPEAACRTGCRLRLRVEPDGRVHYEPATPSFQADQLSDLAGRLPREHLAAVPEATGWGWGDTPKGEFTLSAQWGTTLAANDQVVLAILNDLWLLGGPVLTNMAKTTREPPANTEPGLCRLLALNSEGRVTELRVQDFLRRAPLPPELGQLTGLQCLHLELPANEWYLDFGMPTLYDLIGPIPPELGQFQQSLETLDLSWNWLTGPLPDALEQFRNLQALHLRTNDFSGPLPPAWGRLSNLTELDLSHNQLTGSLPPAWAQLPQLQRLVLDDNQLTGSLPPAWAQLTNLTNLYLVGNPIAGCLPPAWRELSTRMTGPDCLRFCDP